MKLTENDHNAVVRTFLEFLSQVMRSSPSEPPDQPHGSNRVVELPDAGYTLQLEATFVPRGAMVIAPSGTPVHGPAAVNRCEKAFPGFAVGPPWCGKPKGHAGECDDWVPV